MRQEQLRYIGQRRDRLTEHYLEHMYERDGMQEKTGRSFQEVAPILVAVANMVKANPSFQVPEAL